MISYRDAHAPSLNPPRQSLAGLRRPQEPRLLLRRHLSVAGKQRHLELRLVRRGLPHRPGLHQRRVRQGLGHLRHWVLLRRQCRLRDQHLRRGIRWDRLLLRRGLRGHLLRRRVRQLLRRFQQLRRLQHQVSVRNLLLGLQLRPHPQLRGPSRPDHLPPRQPEPRPLLQWRLHRPHQRRLQLRHLWLQVPDRRHLRVDHPGLCRLLHGVHRVELPHRNGVPGPRL